MLSFISHRLLLSIALLFGISLISFFIITLTPGSPYPWGELNPKISPEIKEAFRHKFYLDRSLPEQYYLNMRDLFSGQLRSTKDGRAVLSRIAERLPATLALNVFSIILSLSFGLLFGICSAQYAKRWPDTMISLCSFILLALPTFWIAYLVAIGLTHAFGIPILGTVSFGIEFPSPFSAFLDHFWHLALPGTLLALGGIAIQSRYLQTSLLATWQEDYIRTARAKGLSETDIFYKHALRNALRPLITGLGGLLPAFLGGAVIIENIFAYPGIGRLVYESMIERDYPTLVALNFFTAGLVLLGNLLADVLYAVVDPRVRTGGQPC